MNKSDEIKLANHDLYKNSYDLYKQIIKRLLKAIPRSELINLLIEMKILKQDYLTKELSIKQKKHAKKSGFNEETKS